MAVSYTKTNWVNGSTKLNADNMNHIEKGIDDLVTEINSQPTSVSVANYNISFSLTNGSNSSNYRISFMITLSDDMSLNYVSELEPYIPNSTDAITYGIPVSVYNAETENSSGLGFGRMSAHGGDFYFVINCNGQFEEITLSGSDVDAYSEYFSAEQLPVS